jgi:PhzF family phenazine biosynthesis protein
MQTFIVDAFTQEPFKGNPAGVCFPERTLTDSEMLSIASELGFSETAFVTTDGQPERYRIRFFTPKSEIALCGHATLGSAKVIFEKTALDKVHFMNVENLELVARRANAQVEMEFPVYEVIPSSAPAALLKALGITEIENCVYNQETEILMIEIPSAAVLQNLAPDFTALVSSHDAINGVLVTARATDGRFDFYSRYFWPWKGTNEDPVTGGSHTFMAKYWSRKLHKKKMRSFQASARTGILDVELVEEDTKLLIKGDAVILFEGTMRL